MSCVLSVRFGRMMTGKTTNRTYPMKRQVTRAERKAEFAAEIFLAASFFKMDTISGWKTPSLDAKIVKDSGSLVPLYNPMVKERYIPKLDKMPKFPKGK